MTFSETIAIEDPNLIKVLKSEFGSVNVRGCSVYIGQNSITITGESEKIIKPIIRSILQSKEIFYKILTVK